MLMLILAFLRKNSLFYAIALSVVSLGIEKQALAQTVIPLDLISWETLGDVEVLNPGLANLSTDALIEDDFDLGVPNGTFNFSGNPASPVEGFGSEPFLDDFLNIDVSILDGDTFALEGSAIKTSVTVRQDDVLSFDWNFLTNETSPQIVTQFDDYSFFLVNEDLTTLATIDDTTVPGSLLGFDRETGTNSMVM